MKKIILKTTTFLFVFLISVLFISKVMNQGNMDLTKEVKPASFPVAYIMKYGERANAMFGYSDSINPQAVKDTITPIGDDRNVKIEVDTYGNEISKVFYEVRSIDGKRLVENTQIFNYTVSKDLLKIDFSIKDLISPDLQYALVLLLEKSDGEVLRYYARVIQNDKYHLEEHIQFAKDFHDSTFQKAAAAIITDHVESNSQGDNTTYAHVNIHSKVDQITWGSLSIKNVTKPVYMIQEIQADSCNILLQYLVTVDQDGEDFVYRVEEFFRTRYTSDRMYLLAYNRTMDQLLTTNHAMVMNDKIMLGISTGEVELIENQAATNLAFLQRDALFSFHIAENKLAVLYNPYEIGEIDYRTVFARQKVKILSVDELGGVIYLVYGHISQGDREGQVGIQVFQYDATKNSIEEVTFIPYDQSENVLMADVDRMSYLNINNILFVILGNNLYRVSLTESNFEVMVENLLDSTFQYSADNSMIAWLEGESGQDDYAYESRIMTLMDLSTEKKTKIEASANSFIRPLGFMENDLIYGQAMENEIVRDDTGNIIFPMYELHIRNAEGEILKTYQKPLIYVTDLSMKDNLITLKRMKKTEETGLLRETNDDQIICSEIKDERKNTLLVVPTQNYEKIMEIALIKSVTKASTQVLTPKQIILEKSRIVELEDTESQIKRYYVYGRKGIEKIFTDPAKAIRFAAENAGVVTDETGAYIWKNGKKTLSNQIMAIQGVKKEEGKSSLAVCLESMLSFAGANRNVTNSLEEGKTAVDILKNSLKNAQILELRGCPLSTVLYYVSEEYPVLAILKDGSAVLIVGYNQQNTVLMNPDSGAVYKKGIKDSAEWFAENGNVFITYVESKQRN